MKRRTFLQQAAGAALLPLVPGLAAAQEYPSRPVTLIIPWVAGGPTDIASCARFADAASKQPRPADRRREQGRRRPAPSARRRWRRPPSRTATPSRRCQIAVYRVPMMQKTRRMTRRATSPTSFALSGYVFGVTVASGHYAVQDLAGRRRLRQGQSGQGDLRLVGRRPARRIFGMEMHRRAKAGIKLVHVPFKGSAEVNAATAGGHVMLGCSGSSAMPLAQAGKVRFLQIWTRNRISQLPDVPTLRECGYPFDIEGPIGLAGPKGMDPKVVQKIHNAFKASLDDPEVLAVLKKLDLFPAYMSGADYKAFLKDNMEVERKILTELGLVKKDG
jgi:hypothetical protein